MNLFYDLVMFRVMRHRFAEKMKRTISIISAVLYGISSLAQDKAALGLEVSSLLYDGSICIAAGHGFSSKWSAEFSTEIKGWPEGRDEDKEYMDHLAEFDDVPYAHEDTEACCRMSVRYWMNETYKGAFVGIGCRCARDRSPDCTLDIGYSMPVRKNLILALHYGTDLIATYKEGKAAGQGIAVGLYWTIKTRKR